MQTLVDRFMRVINYLRISVTDRCNLRCKYCMTVKGIKLLPQKDILTYEEILRIIRITLQLGVYRFRITGGEPLLRDGIVGFLERAVKTAQEYGCTACEFTLTTNGVLLEKMAQEVYDAGIRRINVSLDTLCYERFIKINGRNELVRVVRGIKKAVKIGFSPVKVNVVIMRGFNEDEIDDFIKFAIKQKVIVRFIEQMPFGYFERPKFTDHSADYVALNKIEDEMVKKYNLKLTETPGAGPGRHYGFTGFIPARSRPFCSECNRLRLTSNGKLRLCLGFPYEIDLRTQMRSGATDEQLKEIFVEAISNKPEKHEFEKKMEKECMAQIGG
ncbi:MAG: GTP 3',8-cyclase MoaA [Elusimicrobiota bacterium]